MAEARDFLSTTYRARNARMTGDPDTFEFTAFSRRLDLFCVDVLQHNGHFEMEAGPSDYVYVAEILQGRLHVTTSEGRRRSLGPGDAVMTSVDEPRPVFWDDIAMVVVRLDALEVRRIAAELTGVDLAGLRFHRRLASPTQARQWSAAVAYVVKGVLSNPAAADHTLAQQESFRLLVTTALETFPQAELQLDGCGAADAAAPPATLRRAIEFIEANAHRDITVADISRAAHLSVRGTQAAFHRHLNSSPAAYLRRVRLAGAHRDLVAADPTQGESVADVAARWGFLHLGHFAASYRKYYGVPPSHTLTH